MSPVEIGIIGIAALFVLMALGMPIGVTMGLAGIVGLASITNVGPALVRLGLTAFGTTANYVIAALPLFVLMSEFAYISELSEESYRVAYKWLGHLPGGLAIATIAGCAGFSAVCGSSPATAVTMGSVALPEMRKYRYSPTLSTGSVAAGGTLGILIPPSGAFIVYGIITEQSIGKLFISGIFPGILLAFLFMITIYILAKLNPTLAPAGPKSSWRERLIAIKDMWGVVILFLVVMGGIYGGVFTPTEAAGIGAFFAFLIGLVRRKLTKEKVIISFRNMIRTTGMIFLILIGAMLFSYFIARSGLTTALADFIVGLPLPPLGILASILFLFLVLGCFMDAYAMVLIIIPVLFPAILSLGFDPIWFAVLTVIMMEMGMITPPVGMNVFVISGIAKDVPMYTIFRGVLPFVLSMAVCIAIIIAFPQIALFLVTTMR